MATLHQVAPTLPCLIPWHVSTVVNGITDLRLPKQEGGRGTIDRPSVFGLRRNDNNLRGTEPNCTKQGGNRTKLICVIYRVISACHRFRRVARCRSESALSTEYPFLYPFEANTHAPGLVGSGPCICPLLTVREPRSCDSPLALALS